MTDVSPNIKEEGQKTVFGKPPIFSTFQNPRNSPFYGKGILNFEHHCEIENEQSVSPSEPTQHCAGVERDFCSTIKLLEQHRQPSNAGEFNLPAQILPSTAWNWQPTLHVTDVPKSDVCKVNAENVEVKLEHAGVKLEHADDGSDGFQYMSQVKTALPAFSTCLRSRLHYLTGQDCTT